MNRLFKTVNTKAYPLLTQGRFMSTTANNHGFLRFHDNMVIQSSAIISMKLMKYGDQNEYYHRHLDNSHNIVRIFVNYGNIPQSFLFAEKHSNEVYEDIKDFILNTRIGIQKSQQPANGLIIKESYSDSSDNKTKNTPVDKKTAKQKPTAPAVAEAIAKEEQPASNDEEFDSRFFYKPYEYKK